MSWTIPTATGLSPAGQEWPRRTGKRHVRRIRDNEPVSAPDNFYDEVGGHATFATIVARFYQEVAADPVLRSLYPEKDLGPAEHRFLMFLEQYWGGPRSYSDQRGHPRLRMRHMPFRITITERDAWLRAIGKGVDAVDLTAEQRERLWSYLVMAADSLVNTV